MLLRTYERDISAWPDVTYACSRSLMVYATSCFGRRSSLSFTLLFAYSPRVVGLIKELISTEWILKYFPTML